MCLIFVLGDFSIVLANNLTAKEKNNIEIKYEGEPLTNFKITSGLDKKIDYTFDSKRTISGVAENNTKISFYTYVKNKKNEFELSDPPIELIVEKSGIFNKVINFGLGETKLVIVAENNKKSAKVEAILYRMDANIKKELKNNLLPEQKIKSNNAVH